MSMTRLSFQWRSSGKKENRTANNGNHCRNLLFADHPLRISRGTAGAADGLLPEDGLHHSCRYVCVELEIPEVVT